MIERRGIKGRSTAGVALSMMSSGGSQVEVEFLKLKLKLKLSEMRAIVVVRSLPKVSGY